MEKEQMFQFEIGDMQGQRFLRLMGKMYTGAGQFCDLLQRGLLDGQVNISIKDDTISFIAEGVSLNFQDDCKKLANLETMINTGGVRIESSQDIRESYEGFQLLFNC